MNTSQPPQLTLQPAGGDDEAGHNQLMFSTDSREASEAMERMRMRLKDPELRPALRTEQRISIQQQHPEVAEALAIEPGVAEKLIDLLTDLQMQSLDQVHDEARPGALGANNDWTAINVRTQMDADAETRRIEALRDLLGQEGLERYQDYSTTLGARGEVASFDARLNGSDKLRPDQKNRLMALLHEQTLRDIEQDKRSLSFSMASFGPMSLTPGGSVRQTALSLNIAANEASLRRMLEANRLLSRAAAEFLTAAQLAAFSQMNQERADSQRQWVENQRAQAGLDPAIPEHPEAAPDSLPPRTPFAGNVKLDISLAVNGSEPTTVVHIGANGAPTTFQAAADLWVEVTPTLFDDHWLDVQLAYFEENRTGKRRLPSSGGFGVLSRLPDGSPSRGGTVMVVTGSKGYAIDANATATPL